MAIASLIAYHLSASQVLGAHLHRPTTFNYYSPRRRRTSSIISKFKLLDLGLGLFSSFCGLFSAGGFVHPAALCFVQLLSG